MATNFQAKWQQLLYTPRHTLRDISGESIVVINPNPDPNKITGSFGFIQAEGQESFQTLLKLADQAMYLAKQQGKNRVIQCKAAESCVYREEEA